MKKIARISPLMLVAPLLMGCGSARVEKPKFLEKGTEITIAEFKTAYSEILSNSALNKEEQMLPSAVIKHEVASKSFLDWTRNGKVAYSKKESSSSQRKIQIDMDNAFSFDEKKGDSQLIEKNAGKNYSEKTTINEKRSLQEVKGEKKTYLVEADLKEKSYKKIRELEGNKTAKEALDDKVRDSKLGLVVEALSSFFSKVATFYGAPSEEELTKHKVYQNEKIFTIEYEEKIENEMVRVNEATKTQTNKSTTEIWQINLTDGNISYKHYKYFASRVEYHDEYLDHAEGEIVTDEKEISETASYEYSSSIKAKKPNIGKFVPLFNVE